ncbi:efflux RND transporter permease subunit [Thorsellia kenyensis]|uniref:Efflux RND transporter permease subunit n=1 Tax=Thorsellia kenyensis TaxID=1549888 RepID=A0ABV6C848_9GAMM
MPMPLSTWSIRNPIPPLVLFLVLIVAGSISFKFLPITQLPNLVIPIVVVNVNQPGAAPSEMETQVTQKIEGAVTGITGVKHINSTISEGSSSTMIEFYMSTEIDRAVNDTRDAISKIRSELPNNVLDPVIERLEAESQPILIYTLGSSELNQEELSWYIDDTLSRELLAIPGVASVSRNGGIDREIILVLNPERLSAYGISAAQVSQQISSTNINMPSGRFNVGDQEYTLRTLGSQKTIEELENLWIHLNNDQQVKLTDLGNIVDGTIEQRNLTRQNNLPVITFSITRSKGSSDINVGDAVAKKISELSAKNPNLKFSLALSMVEFTQTTYDSTIYTFFEAAILTILVIFIFLKDIRATFIAAITIPLSIIPTFIFMNMMGFSLNMVSLLAISLVTGVLVDDAIVEIENIHRHMKEGLKPFKASVIAANEIGLAVVATTMVICSVFVPVSFMDGIAGQYFREFGLTVAISAFFSLVVARLLTPMLCAYFLKMPKYLHDEEKQGFIMKRYQSILRWTLAHRAKTVSLAFLVMFFSFGLAKYVPSDFIPASDYGQSRLSVQLPRGVSAKDTDAIMQEISAILEKREEVVSTITSVSSQNVNRGEINIKLLPADERTLSQREFESDVLPSLLALADVKVEFSKVEGGKDLSYNLIGSNSELLTITAQNIAREMRTLPELISVNTSASERQPELTVTPDYAKAASLGITPVQIGQALNIASLGDIEANLGKFSEGSRQLPIRVRLPAADKQNIEILHNLPIKTANGNSVPLSAIASFEFNLGPTVIERYDRIQKIAIEANLNNVVLGEAESKFFELPSVKNLPEGITLTRSGDSEVFAELLRNFFLAIGAGLLLVYIVQVLLYKDWLQPLTRMAALPLSIGGAFLLLLITDTAFSMPVMIGMLMLMGIADKNAILLVDYMLELLDRGYTKQEAILKACQVRARPIIMTSLAMLAGMIPISLGIGLNTEFKAPMAVAVVGGLISSTLLSLIFVPVLFSLMRDFREFLAKKLRPLVNQEE